MSKRSLGPNIHFISIASEREDFRIHKETIQLFSDGLLKNLDGDGHIYVSIFVSNTCIYSSLRVDVYEMARLK